MMRFVRINLALIYKTNLSRYFMLNNRKITVSHFTQFKNSGDLLNLFNIQQATETKRLFKVFFLVLGS